MYHFLSTDVDTLQPTSSSAAAYSAAYVLAPIIQQRLAAVQQRVAELQLPIHHSFNAPLFTGTMTFPGQERDWLLMPLAEDPAWNAKDGYPLPGGIIAQLRQLKEAQLDFDTIYVAHEVPKLAGYLLGPAERASHLAPPVSTKAQSRAAALGTAAATLVKAAVAPALLTGVVSVAAAAAASVLVGMDPILFGVIADSKDEMAPGSAAAWVYLCHWNWT